MTPLYFCLFHKLYHDQTDPQNTKLCVIGDKNQSIYGYNGAGNRFITLDPLLYKWNSYDIILGEDIIPVSGTELIRHVPKQIINPLIESVNINTIRTM